MAGTEERKRVPISGASGNEEKRIYYEVVKHFIDDELVKNLAQGNTGAQQGPTGAPGNPPAGQESQRDGNNAPQGDGGRVNLINEARKANRAEGGGEGGTAGSHSSVRGGDIMLHGRGIVVFRNKPLH